MAMARRTHSFRSTLGACALAAWAGAAGAADLPEPVKKLTGSSEDTARSVMTQQAYVLRNEKTSWGRDYGYWWNHKRRECVQLMSMGGRILQVQAKGESDCKAGAIAGAAGASAPAAALDLSTLAGQPRGTADQRLTRAGYWAVEADMRVEGTVYLTWTDGRRCLGATIVNDRYERVEEMSKQGCYIK
jgi:hypothetical protein